jgi:fumarate hydratase class II
MTDFRTERDSIGEVRIPSNMLYGAQTQRAVENFRVSGIRFPRGFLRALGLIKAGAAKVNAESGLLDHEKSRVIQIAADEVAKGVWDEHFPVDIFQTGSGTSTNMNANEVIATRSNQLLTGKKETNFPVHPNDDVNMGQSSNDVIPTAIHVATYLLVEELLLPSMELLRKTIASKAFEFQDSVKTGRTHLMDAMPITLGQEMSGWETQVDYSLKRVRSALPRLAQLAIGGTAVGTGINTLPDFGAKVSRILAGTTGIPFKEAENHFEAQSAQDAVVELSGQLRAAATVLMKIANDVRWMNSGPLGGLSEIQLPALQPGSSIMPGKVNPVIPEATRMVCAQVMGNDAVIAIANASGDFQLNVMLPVIAHNIIQSVTILANAAALLAVKAMAGFEVNEDLISGRLHRNPIIATVLNPVIGYDKAAEVVKEALREKKTVKRVAVEKGYLSEEEAEKLLNPRNMTKAGILGSKEG